EHFDVSYFFNYIFELPDLPSPDWDIFTDPPINIPLTPLGSSEAEVEMQYN
ncbi:898_t:CDS:1, partial [Scutellospora calospora]